MMNLLKRIFSEINIPDPVRCMKKLRAMKSAFLILIGEKVSWVHWIRKIVSLIRLQLYCIGTAFSYRISTRIVFVSSSTISKLLATVSIQKQCLCSLGYSNKKNFTHIWSSSFIYFQAKFRCLTPQESVNFVFFRRKVLVNISEKIFLFEVLQ